MWTVYYTVKDTNERKEQKFETEEKKEKFYEILLQSGEFKNIAASFGRD